MSLMRIKIIASTGWLLFYLDLWCVSPNRDFHFATEMLMYALDIGPRQYYVNLCVAPVVRVLLLP
jgi:hypothetical protein